MLSLGARVYKCALVTYVDCMIYPLSTVKDTLFRGFQPFKQLGKGIQCEVILLMLVDSIFHFTSGRKKKQNKFGRERMAK